jgi:thioredoxin-like negative regulator of GroEL
MKRTSWLIGVAVLLLVCALAGAWGWREAAARAAVARTLAAAERAVAGSRWTEARAILEDQARRRGRPAEAASARRWVELEYRVAGGLRDFATMEALVARDASLAGLDEDAALWLWRMRRVAGDEAAAETVRALWRGREKMPVAWTCAEVDALWASGRREAARELIGKAKGGADRPDSVPLWLREAMLGADATARFEALATAYRLDPANADLRGLRAVLLERSGQPAYARVDYVAALVSDPANPLRRDDLASFYLRQGDLVTAVETWREGLAEKSPDFLWVRAAFWGRVAGMPFAPEVARLAENRKGRFAGWLALLPPGRFWDEAGYAALHLPVAHAQSEPAVFWLRLLEQLRGGDWAAAGDMMSAAPTTAAASDPGLLAALRTTAAVRQGTAPSATGLAWPGASAVEADAHRWWKVVAAALRGDPKAGEEFAAVAAGPQAAAAALLAAGWTGPALELADWAAAGKAETPGWVRFGLLEARRLVRGPADALAWGETLPEYPQTDYAVAALKLAAGRADAEPALRRLAARKDDTGFAAGWLLATWLLERGRSEEAAELVAADPALAGSPEGAGLRARAALAAGRKNEARSLFEPLADTSLEAGAWLAREAFAAGDLAEARRLTEFWSARYPDDLQLRANLAAIAAVEQAKAGAVAK